MLQVHDLISLGESQHGGHFPKVEDPSTTEFCGSRAIESWRRTLLMQSMHDYPPRSLKQPQSYAHDAFPVSYINQKKHLNNLNNVGKKFKTAEKSVNFELFHFSSQHIWGSKLQTCFTHIRFTKVHFIWIESGWFDEHKGYFFWHLKW